MDENDKTKKPIITSVLAICIINVISVTFASPVTLIMSIFRFKKYPERKNMNFVALGISIVCTIVLIVMLANPSAAYENAQKLVAEEPVTEEAELDTGSTVEETFQVTSGLQTIRINIPQHGRHATEEI